MGGFDTPFRHSELVGFFHWDNDLTASLKRKLPWVYHACHETQFRLFHRRNELFLRSMFEVIGGRDDSDSYECTWTSLHPWHVTHGHNHFGPISVKMPLDVLEGRRFYVFERDLRGWKHFYFVQRECKSPLFGMKRRADRISPSSLFRRQGAGGRLNVRADTHYEIVLTDSVGLKNAKFIATDHEWCAARQCSGREKVAALQTIDAELQLELEKLRKRFPQLNRSFLKAME
jgi:hypothetical protein